MDIKYGHAQNANTGPVYDDDTTIIPRSTTVIARRMPAKVQGRGGAARYVSGKMPVHAKNSSRKEQPIVKALAKPVANPVMQLNSAMTEEEKMAAVFQAQTENFTAREEEMPRTYSSHRFRQPRVVFLANSDV